MLLQVDNLVKTFGGIRAVDNLSFEIESGSIVSLVGPNGSGKTTVFNLITGFLKPDSGTILFNNTRISSKPPHSIARAGVGRTFQNIRLFSQLSVLDNIMLAFKYGTGENFFNGLFQTRNMKAKEGKSRKRAEELLHLIGLSEKMDVLAETLSHGNKKLLELARILALDPEIFLLDEPLSGLFPEKRVQMLNHLKELNRNGKTIILIEHDINVVMSIAKRIIVLGSGTKIACGSPEEIKANKNVLSAYLGKAIL